METTPTILVASAEYITLAKAIVLTDDNRKHQLVMAFGPFLAQAEIWKAKAAAINVTDITQTADMMFARESRLALKDIRVECEHRRKKMKEGCLAEGRAIDAAYNLIELTILPIEATLREHETFAERAEQARIAVIKKTREDALRPYDPNAGAYNLMAMDDAMFAVFLADRKTTHEAKVKADKDAETQRLAAEALKADQARKDREDADVARAEAIIAQRAAQGVPPVIAAPAPITPMVVAAPGAERRWLMDYSDTISGRIWDVPVMRSPAGKAVGVKIHQKINDLVRFIREQAETL